MTFEDAISFITPFLSSIWRFIFETPFLFEPFTFGHWMLGSMAVTYCVRAIRKVLGRGNGSDVGNGQHITHRVYCNEKSRKV